MNSSVRVRLVGCIKGRCPSGYSFSWANFDTSRQTSSQKVVAIKVIDVDDADFRAFGDAKDEQINDFNKEIRILRQAQESGAPNLNQMIEALPVHSQLWLICEYCPGGSVKTLVSLFLLSPLSKKAVFEDV